MRDLGFAGAHIGGFGLTHADFLRIMDRSLEIGAALLLGIDGLVFSYRVWRGTFLPQVWEQLPEPRDFLAQLRLKAGLSADFWAPGVKLERYTVTKWRETQ